MAFKTFKDNSNYSNVLKLSCSLDLDFSQGGCSGLCRGNTVNVFGSQQWVRDLYLTFRLLRSFKSFEAFHVVHFAEYQRGHGTTKASARVTFILQPESKRKIMLVVSAALLCLTSLITPCVILQIADVLSNLNPATLQTLVRRLLLYIIKCWWTVHHSFQLFVWCGSILLNQLWGW